MKPTIRVSIGGLAFNLDEDAYRVLNNYLQALKNHFAGNPEADEIIGDIEARLSELLQMRINNAEGVVSLTDADEIVKIMGNPKDFDDSVSDGNTSREESAQQAEKKDTSSTAGFGKKLYRDIDNKIIGGVCSGLGHYFRIDVTLVRLIFLVLLFSSIFLIGRIGPTVLLVYVVLWIVMPPARSFVQRLAMTGSDPSIENIEDRTQSQTRKYRGSAASNVVGVLVNIVAVFIAIVTVISLVAMISVFVWIYFDSEVIGINNYLILTGFSNINYKIAIVAALTLPALGLFALMMKIVKRSSFTTQTLVIFIIGLVCWVGALSYIGSRSVSFANAHRYNEEVVESVPLNTTADTIYLKLGTEYLEAKSQPNNSAVFYKDDKYKGRQICILPEVDIREDSTLTNVKVEIQKRDFADNQMTARRKAEALKLDYNLNDSLLTINPKWYSNADAWNLEMFRIVVTTPPTKKVLLEMPLNESYNINMKNMHCNGYHIGYDCCSNNEYID